MWDKKTSNQRALLFILGLITSELIQFFLISESGYLGGDFSKSMTVGPDLVFSLALSALIWLITYIIFWISRSDESAKVYIPVTFPVLLIFAFNLILTVWTNVGYALDATKSEFSILTTLIPINYLILVNAQQPKLDKKFFIAAVILAVVDLYRLLLGGIFKLVYITLMRANRKLIFAIFLTLPLSFVAVQTLLIYKFESRGIRSDHIEEAVVGVVTARIATLSTTHFMFSNADELVRFCHKEDYASPWLAAGLSVIPKKIFGLEYVKTYNNCLIEFNLNRDVPDSGVNSPWLMTLHIESLGDLTNFLSYFVLTAGLLYAIIKIANYLFGASGDIFKMWVIFEFMWTGNILHLTIPFYFLCLILFYLWIKKGFSSASMLPIKEKINESIT